MHNMQAPPRRWRLRRLAGHLIAGTGTATAAQTTARSPSIAELNKNDIMPTDYEEYLFDLRGYVVLKSALSPEHVAELNRSLDSMPLDRLMPGDWWGHVHGHSYGGVWADGLNLQQIYEAGEPWERLIDHPSWIGKVRHFVGGEDTFDYGAWRVSSCHAPCRASALE
jgi:hypothetical protein